MFASLAASPASFCRIRVLLDSLDVTVESARPLRLPDVHVTPFRISSEEMNFPLAVVAIGAAAAEKAVAGKAENLVWLLEDTLVLKSPSAFVLPAWK